MSTTVVTFSVQLGAQGEELARQVSNALGYRYYDRDIVTKAAEAAGVSEETIAQSERWPGFLERMIESLSLTAAFSEAMLAPGPSSSLTMSSGDYRRLVEDVLRELGQRGNCVIVGHAGQVILRDRSDTLRVLVHGSAEQRALELSKVRAISPEEARQAIEDADNQRIDFFHHLYGVDWLSPSLYDITINTDRLAPAEALHAILGASGVRRT